MQLCYVAIAFDEAEEAPVPLLRLHVCTSAQKLGWHTCPSKSIPAEEIEQFVIDQIKCIGRDPNLVVETVDQASRLVKAELAALKAVRRTADERRLTEI